jgi:hypothetical protein
MTNPEMPSKPEVKKEELKQAFEQGFDKNIIRNAAYYLKTAGLESEAYELYKVSLKESFEELIHLLKSEESYEPIELANIISDRAPHMFSYNTIFGMENTKLQYETGKLAALTYVSAGAYGAASRYFDDIGEADKAAEYITMAEKYPQTHDTKTDKTMLLTALRDFIDSVKDDPIIIADTTGIVDRVKEKVKKILETA